MTLLTTLTEIIFIWIVAAILLGLSIGLFLKSASKGSKIDDLEGWEKNEQNKRAA